MSARNFKITAIAALFAAMTFFYASASVAMAQSDGADELSAPTAQPQGEDVKCLENPESPQSLPVSSDYYAVDENLVKVDGGVAILYFNGDWCKSCRDIKSDVVSLSARYPVTWIDVPKDKSRRIPAKRFYSRLTGRRNWHIPHFIWLDVSGDKPDFADKTSFSVAETYQTQSALEDLLKDLAGKNFTCAPSGKAAAAESNKAGQLSDNPSRPPAKKVACAASTVAPKYHPLSSDGVVAENLMRVSGGGAIIYFGGEWCPYCAQIKEEMKKLSAQYPVTWVHVPKDRTQRIPSKRFYKRLTGRYSLGVPTVVWLDVHGDRVDFFDESTFSLVNSYAGTKGFRAFAKDVAKKQFPCAPSKNA